MYHMHPSRLRIFLGTIKVRAILKLVFTIIGFIIMILFIGLFLFSLMHEGGF